MCAFLRALSVALLFSASAASAETFSGTYMPGQVHAEEAKSRALCESDSNRIFVPLGKDSECVAFSMTKGFDDRRQAVFFFDGDPPPAQDAAAFDDYMMKDKAMAEKLMSHYAEKFKIQYFYVSRLGVQGSSGNSQTRRTGHETAVFALATQLLAKRFNVDKIGIAGQSGGSSIGAGLLTMGFTGAKCLALGSGAYDLVGLHYDFLLTHGKRANRALLERTYYNPIDLVSNIEPDVTRRIFVIGDPQDQNAKFVQQRQFVSDLQANGNNANLIEVAAYNHHGATTYSLVAAAECMNGETDSTIEHGLATMTAKAIAREKSKQPSP